MNYLYYCLLSEKKALKYLVQGPDVQKNLRLSSHTPGYSLKSCPGHYKLNLAKTLY